MSFMPVVSIRFGLLIVFLSLLDAGGVVWGQGRADLSQASSSGEWSALRGGDASASFEPFGAEEFADRDNRPRIPEPLVFDLVRPLGATKGESEVNVLGLVSLDRDESASEWAPEVEVAIADGFALEFELPFEDWTLESYKGAGQLTFGTAFEERFIHGTQGILVYSKRSQTWTPTLLYVAGVEFDEHWSMLGMAGIRTEIDGAEREHRTERLFNLSLFRHVGQRSTVGLETNSATSLGGRSEFLLMPQLHSELTDQCMVQLGAGCLFADDQTLPLGAFRVIYSF